MPDEEPKIIVDSDWKQEAREEKERLERETASVGQEQPLADASFLEIVNMIAMQAIIGLGGMNMGDGRQVPPDLRVAKHHIDLLEILQAKTTDKLDDTEQQVLDATLHELRMGFVQASTTTSGEPEEKTTD